MIITSDRPWRRHDRRARRLLIGAVLLAAALVITEWLWWFGPSLFTRIPNLPSPIQSIHRAGEITYARSTGLSSDLLLDVAATDDVTSKNWLITHQFDSSLLVRSETMTTNDVNVLHGQATFYLDPPFSLTSTDLAYFASGLALEVNLADGSRVWILELRRPAHQYKRLYNVENYPQRGLYRRDIIALDESRSRLLLSVSRYENLVTGTLRFATYKFLAIASLLLLIVAWPVGQELLRSWRVRTRFQARCCVACGYPLRSHDHGVQACTECGQLQWPAESARA